MKLSNLAAATSMLLGLSAPALAQHGPMVEHHTVVTHRTVVVHRSVGGPRHCRTVWEHHHRVRRCAR